MSFLKDKQFTKSMMMLAVPVAMQNLITAVLNIFDQIMVGYLPSGMADNCLSAVILVNQIVLIYTIVLFATANAVNIFIAQYTDDVNKKLIPQRTGVAFSIAIITGIIFTLCCVLFSDNIIALYDASSKYDYLASEFLSVVAWSFIPMAITTTISFVLRAIRKMRHAIMANIIGVACNIVFNYVLMFGIGSFEGLGFIGAAYGTIAARIIEMIIIVVLLIVHKYPIIAHPKVMLARDKVFMKQFTKVFFPILFNEVSWAMSCAVFLYAFDKQPNSEVVLAAYNITSTVDKLLSVAMIGVGAAACISLGNVIAEKDTAKTMKMSKYCMQFGALCGVVIGAIYVISAFIAPQVFGNVSAEAQEMAKYMIIIYGVTAVARSLAFMSIVGVLRSGGDTMFCVIVESCIIWLVAVPLVLLGGLVWGWNAYVLLCVIMAAEFLKAGICIMRSRTTKWIKLVL